MRRRGLVLLVTLGALVPPCASLCAARELRFEDRVMAQKAIEQVYWNHRIRPKENPQGKPPLSSMMPDSAIRAKVEDYLKKSNALEKWWQRPVTAAQLQAELDRMSKDTRDPEMLRELYAALGNDARLIAETLARPTLVDRLIRNWYATDERFHGEVGRSAREAAAGVRSASEMPALGGTYITAAFRLAGAAEQDGRERTAAAPDSKRVISLDAEEWADWGARLAGCFGGADAGSIPTDRPSPLQEDADRYFIVALLARPPDELTVATVTWEKHSWASPVSVDGFVKQPVTVVRTRRG